MNIFQEYMYFKLYIGLKNYYGYCSGSEFADICNALNSGEIVYTLTSTSRKLIFYLLNQRCLYDFLPWLYYKPPVVCSRTIWERDSQISGKDLVLLYWALDCWGQSAVSQMCKPSSKKIQHFFFYINKGNI